MKRRVIDSIDPAAGRLAKDDPSGFDAGWRAGYAGAPKRGKGADYDRGWSAGHAQRIIDRATQV